MVEQVKKYLEQQNISLAGKTLVLAVSGGADSVCLLDIFSRLQIVLDLKLVCVHVNHGLRAAAAEDEAFVRGLAGQKGIPFYVLHADVRKEAQIRKTSEEEAGRLVRYEYLNRIAKEVGADYILTAHHRGDLAETVLFHLFRGSSLRGLGGIRVLNGRCLRPLLFVSREEIEAYLKERELSFVTDETNAQEVYSRNRIRHRILPEAEDIVPNAAKHIVQAAEELQETEEFLQEETGRAYGRFVSKEGDRILISEQICETLPALIAKRVVYEAITACCKSAKDIGRTHVQEVRALFSRPCGKRIHLPYDVTAIRYKDGVTLKRQNCRDEKELLSEVMVPAMADTFFLLEKGVSARSETVQNPDIKNIPQKRYTKWFNYDTINCYPVFRKRRSGDYLVIDGNGRKKSLNRYFIDEKIPACERDDIWLLADENHVLWVLGYRISEACKVTEQTRSVVQWEIEGIEEADKGGT